MTRAGKVSVDRVYDLLILTWSYIADPQRNDTASGHFLFTIILGPRDIVLGRSKCQKWILHRKCNTFIFENFEIHQKFAAIGRFEFGGSLWNRWFSWFPLISLDLLDFLCVCKGNVKGNQANQWKSRKSAVSEGNSKLKSTYLGEFLMDFKIFKIFRYSCCAGNRFLAFKNAGAYCYSMASNYNSRFRPAEILWHNNQAHLIRERETMDDILKNQVEVSLS